MPLVYLITSNRNTHTIWTRLSTGKEKSLRQFWQSQSGFFSGIKDAARTSTCQRPTKSDPDLVCRAMQGTDTGETSSRLGQDFWFHQIHSKFTVSQRILAKHRNASLHLLFISKLAKAVFSQEALCLTAAEKVMPA